MNFLLKIVEGPNKGAEIALVDGVAVTIGKSDTCDIVLADQTLGDEPMRIEAASGGVTLDGERLEPLHVASRGSTAFAVGPADAAWDALVWPAREQAHEAPDDGRAAPPPPDVPGRSPDGEASAKKRTGCLGCLIALALFVLVLAVLGWLFRDRVRPCVEKAWRSASGAAEQSAGARSGECGVSTNSTLPALMARLGLVETNRNGRAVLAGDFATRAERLAATAEAYAARPGIELDFADGESLKTAVADTLALVGETALSVMAVTNRVAVLAGSPKNLRRTLEALSADVPKLVNVDVAGVTVANGAAEQPPKAADNAAAPQVAPEPDAFGEAARPESLPVCGILTKPYPCLVLKSGSRVLEGGTIGEWTILKIEADTVAISNQTGRFAWKP